MILTDQCVSTQAGPRSPEIATWDDRLLAGQLTELSELDLSFEIETIGFDIAEIDLRIASLSETAVAECSPCEPSKLGDIAQHIPQRLTPS